MFANIDPYILAFSAITVVATIWMGFWSARKSKTASDFFVAGRSVSVGWNASAISGEYLSAASFMGVAGMVMSSGYDALWYPVCYACGYLFLLLFIAGPLRRFGAYTIPDFAEGRFDSPVFRKIAVIFVLFIGFFYTMPQMKGAGTTLAYIFPGLPYWAGVVLVGAVITLNVALGGMKGITLVQAFQYWAKMFAISVPIFVLMAVYGQYGKQVGVNGTPSPSVEIVDIQVVNEITSLVPHQLDPRIAPIKARHRATLDNPLSMANWRYRINRALRSEEAQAGSINGLTLRFLGDVLAGNLSGDVFFSTNCDISRILKGTNRITWFSELDLWETVRSQLQQDELSLVSGLNDEILIVTHKELDAIRDRISPRLRRDLPINAPADSTWLNPFGPLTTKAAKAAAAAAVAPRWNLTPELRASLVDIGNAHPPGLLDRVGNSVDDMFDGSPAKTPPTPSSAFADWTNMPPNSRRTIPAGVPMLSMLREYGLLDGRPVLVATNLPTQNVVPDGSFQTRAQFLTYLETLFLTNGVRLDLSGENIKAIAVSDWDRYTRDPNSITLVTNRPTGVPLHSESRFLIDQYGEIVGKKAYMATNIATSDAEPTLRFSAIMQPEQTAALVEKTLAERGITLIPAGDEIWAVPTSDLARYQRPVDDERLAYSGEVIAFTNARSSAGVGQWIKRKFTRTSTSMQGGYSAVTNLVRLYASKTLADEVFGPETYVLQFSPGVVAQRVQMEDVDFSSDQAIAEVARDVLAANGMRVVRNGNVFTAARLEEFTIKPLDPRPYALLYTYSLIIALVCGTAGLPHILVRFYTNPDGTAAKRTTMWVMILIGVFYVFPPVFGVIGRNLLPELYAGVGAKGTDKIVLELPRLLNERYSPLGSILSGITCAGAFAAFMSTFSGLLVSMTGALAHDVYGRIIRPKSTPAQRMRMFKIGAVIIGAIAILLGMQVEQLQINFMVGQAFAIAAASYFPLLFMAVWWRKLTMKGAAAGMLTGGCLALLGISLTSFSDLKWIDLADFWAANPLLRILCEQPAIWAVPLAITLMVIVSKLTRREVPSDIRMKMLVLHAPEQLGLKQEYIQEHQQGH